MKKIIAISLLFICSAVKAQKPVDSSQEAKDSDKGSATFKPFFSNMDDKSIDSLSLRLKIDPAQYNKLLYLSDHDIRSIDSLLIKLKFNCTKYDSLYHHVEDIDAKGGEDIRLDTKTLKDRLSSINSKTPFHIGYNIALEKVIRSYLRHRKTVFPTLMARAQYYFPIFERYLDKYDIPLEMKYLAIVESALKPKARSKMGATGLWQFMFQTARHFGLKISSYVDERRDPIKSTIAACKYLSELYKIFKDWDLALAAYNSGPGNVTKAIKRSGGYKNYWNIRPFLPRETANYVPSFYAFIYIFEYSKYHNLKSDKPLIHNFETDTVRIKKTVTFEQISKKTGIGIDILKFLNPSYKLNIIPYIKGKNYVLTLPRMQVTSFLKEETDLYDLASQENAKREKPLPKYFEMDKRLRYKVRRGDFLGKIANKFGVSVKSIKRWNKLISNILRVGQHLYIYPRKFRYVASKNKRNKKKTKLSKTHYTVYVVKKGDSLWKIAKKFPAVSVEQIKKWNNIWSVKDLKIGKKLKIFKRLI